MLFYFIEINEAKGIYLLWKQSSDTEIVNWHSNANKTVVTLTCGLLCDFNVVSCIKVQAEYFIFYILNGTCAH